MTHNSLMKFVQNHWTLGKAGPGVAQRVAVYCLLGSPAIDSRLVIPSEAGMRTEKRRLKNVGMILNLYVKLFTFPHVILS